MGVCVLHNRVGRNLKIRGWFSFASRLFRWYCTKELNEIWKFGVDFLRLPLFRYCTIELDEIWKFGVDFPSPPVYFDDTAQKNWTKFENLGLIFLRLPFISILHNRVGRNLKIWGWFFFASRLFRYCTIQLDEIWKFEVDFPSPPAKCSKFIFKVR